MSDTTIRRDDASVVSKSFSVFAIAIAILSTMFVWSGHAGYFTNIGVELLQIVSVAVMYFMKQDEECAPSYWAIVAIGFVASAVNLITFYWLMIYLADFGNGDLSGASRRVGEPILLSQFVLAVMFYKFVVIRYLRKPKGPVRSKLVSPGENRGGHSGE